jgi:hypothetical protein
LGGKICQKTTKKTLSETKLPGECKCSWIGESEILVCGKIFQFVSDRESTLSASPGRNQSFFHLKNSSLTPVEHRSVAAACNW